MSIDFLTLTNRVLKAFNEVKLNTANFATADGFYEEAKDSINQAIFDIYTEEDTKWPWAWNETTFTTVAGTTEYTIHADASSVDWHSFRLEGDVANDITSDHLSLLDYGTYRRLYWQRDKDTELEERTQPTQVVRKPDNNFIITPVPDQVYTIQYEYYSIPTPLVNYDDTTNIPKEYEQMIIDKALHYAYMFRDNVEQAALANKRYEDNVNKVRRIVIPQFHNVVTLG